MASEPFTMIERRSASSSHQVYDDYQKAYSGSSFDLDVQLRGFLRDQYPKHILTVVPENNVSLLYYASAGKAFAKLDLESENALRYRGYIRGASPGIGFMAESVRFAKYDYRALEEDFILYICQIGFYMYQYILKKPQEGEIITGNSKLTDALLAAIGEFQRPEPIGDDIVYVFDGYWRASRDLYQQVQNASWDDVILDSSMKKALVDIVKKFFDSKEVYDDLGVPWKRGVMFHGPAGNGKTISIKALMHTLHDRKVPIPSLYVKSAPSTYHIRNVFTFARQMAPCMLILEDIDTIVTKNTRSYFFNEVDGLENNDGLLMVGSTNHLDQLDPGLSKRPSRFDRKYLFPLPSQDQRVQYCMFWRNRLAKKNADIKFPKKLAGPMAEKMDQFSFAYMKEAFVATLLAIANNHIGQDPPADGEESVSASLQRVKIDNDGDEHGHDDLHDYELWREFVIQVQILRDDMDSSAAAGEDDGPGSFDIGGACPPPPLHDDHFCDPAGGDNMYSHTWKSTSQQKIIPTLETSTSTPVISDARKPGTMSFDNQYGLRDVKTFYKDGSLTGDM